MNKHINKDKDTTRPVNSKIIYMTVSFSYNTYWKHHFGHAVISDIC